jgi:hypothetical protein
VHALRPSEIVTKPAVHETHSNAASAEYLPVAKRERGRERQRERTKKIEAREDTAW